MARRFQESEGEGETKVDISPLIDCVFILLIFFIVTTTFVDEKGKDVQTPDSNEAQNESDEEPSIVMVDVMPNGQLMSGGQVISMGAVATLIRESRDGTDSPVVIHAVGSAPVGVTLRVQERAEQAGSENVVVKPKAE